MGNHGPESFRADCARAQASQPRWCTCYLSPARWSRGRIQTACRAAGCNRPDQRVAGEVVERPDGANAQIDRGQEGADAGACDVRTTRSATCGSHSTGPAGIERPGSGSHKGLAADRNASHRSRYRAATWPKGPERLLHYARLS